VQIIGTATDDDLIDRFELQRSRYEGPTGIVGVLHDSCYTAAMPSAALWAAVPAYASQVPSPKASLSLLPQISALREKFRAHNRFVLCGMGGSSLGPEVIAQSNGREIFIFDSTDPQYAAHAIGEDLSKTLVIVSSKSGSTIETSSQRALFEGKFLDAALDPKEHILFVTDPGSPLDIEVHAAGFTVINADPNVGGRFSVLSAFGLVPSALIGVDIEKLLSDAQQEREEFLEDPSVILDIAYLLIAETKQYIAFTDDQSKFPGLSDWIEQLIAESTGKDSIGRLPIATENAKVAKKEGH
jgi:glucose-6-phosphate isomerase